MAIADIFACNDLFRSFISKNFIEFNPEQKLRDKEKIDKWALYELLQHLKYNLYFMQFKTREINDMIAKISRNRDDDDDEEDEDDDIATNDSHIMMNGSPPKQPQRQLLFGVLQKIEEMQNLLTEIVCRSLQYSTPSRCMFFGTKNKLSDVKDENYIGMEFSFIHNTTQMMRALVTKQTALFDALNTINLDRIDDNLSNFDRIGKINRLLDDESESSEHGLIPRLEALYKHLSKLPYALEKFYINKVSAPSAADHKTDRELNAIALGQIQTDKLYYMHMELEKELKIEREKKETSLIRTAKNDIEIEMQRSSPPALTPWLQKAKAIKEELERADIIRDALESAQAEIKYKHKELLLEKSNTQQIKSQLEVVTLQLAKQQTINRELVQFELDAKESCSKMMKYKEMNQKLKSERDKLLKKRQELESTVTSYQNTIKTLKLASSRKKIKNVHDDDMSDPREHTRHSSLTRAHSSRSMDPSKHRRGSSVTLGFKNGKLGLGDPSQSLDGIEMNGNDDRIIINQLHKQLDLNKSYNKLLEKTINSLRHSHHIYDLSKQWIEIKRDLRALPSFDSINASQFQSYKLKEEHLIHKQRMIELHKKKQRQKLLQINEGDGEEEAADEDNDGQTESIANPIILNKNYLVSSSRQKQIQTEKYVNANQKLKDLDVEFAQIYSMPHVIDLEKQHKSDESICAYNQQLIGRHLRLKELKLKCSKLSKECKEIESTFSHPNETHNEQALNASNLTVLGEINIEGIKNSNYRMKNTNVCLDRKNVTKLMNAIC